LCWHSSAFGGVRHIGPKNRRGPAQREIWAVPKQWDSLSDAPQGTIEEVVYQTHAYATDKRDVMKSALVYLSAGYDENKQYNILYLLHGSGDDQYYWLRTHEYNKIMLDNMMAAGESRYSTYAGTADEAGFTQSREHRAFAGLS
jgi:enterochelin esterase-like enzyme